MSIRIYIGILITGLFALTMSLLWYLRPEVEIQSNTVAKQVPQQQPMKAMIEAAPISSSSPQVEHIEQPNTEQLMQQRDTLYIQFGQISAEMMEGKKPDLRQFSVLIHQHQQLFQQGIISIEDAENDIGFFSRVFPEMESEIGLYLDEIAQKKREDAALVSES